MLHEVSSCLPACDLSVLHVTVLSCCDFGLNFGVCLAAVVLHCHCWSVQFCSLVCMEKRARMASSLSGLVMFGCKTTIQNDLNYLFLAYTTVWACGVGGGGPQNMGVDQAARQRPD